jgi:hypothetical protein
MQQANSRIRSKNKRRTESAEMGIFRKETLSTVPDTGKINTGILAEDMI